MLRWLRTMRGALRLEVRTEDRPVFSAVFVDGREIRTPASMATLGKALAVPKASYRIIDLGRAPTMSHSGRTLHLIGEVIRAIVSQCAVEELARAFPNQPDKCPRAIPEVVAGLGFPSQHQRFVKTDLDGNQYLDEVTRAAVGSRTVWEVLYLLTLYNGISWDEPAESKKSRTGPLAAPQKERTGSFAQRTGTFTPPDVDLDWAPFDGKDHFQVLGLHWSSSPNEVAPAFQKLRSEYGAGGIKRPSDPAVADRISRRLEEAYRVLNDANQRRAYRREKYNLVWSHQAQLLVQKAKLALYRKDVQEAMNALLTAEDIAPSDEAKAILSSIKQKLG